MKGDVLLHHDYIVRLTWSLPPHSPAGGFAPKPVAPHYYLSRHYFFRQDLLLSRTMLTTTLHCLRGSFCLRLASTFNHRPVHSDYTVRLSSLSIEKSHSTF